MTGRILVFEGLDGVGKTALSKTLAARLDAAWLTTPDPGLRAVRGQIDDRWGPDERALFYAASVRDAGRRAAAVARQGRDVVIDRYWLSTWVYAQVAGASVDLTALEDGVVVPDVTVWVTADERVRRERLRERGASAQDLASIDAADRLRTTYARALTRGPVGWVSTVDASAGSVDALADELAVELNERRAGSHGRAQLALFGVVPSAHEAAWVG